MEKTTPATTDTWYVLEDGTTADPADVAHDEKGVLRNKGGTAVAMRGAHPHTTGNKDRPNPNKKKAKAGEVVTEAPATDGPEQQPAPAAAPQGGGPAGSYGTRESKAK